MSTLTTKYAPLGYYLNHTDALQVTLSFKDIEKIVGLSLPATAKKHPQWWANRHAAGSTQCDSWIKVGWQVFHVDRHRQEVTFIKHPLAAAAN